MNTGVLLALQCVCVCACLVYGASVTAVFPLTSPFPAKVAEIPFGEGGIRRRAEGSSGFAARHEETNACA